MKILIIGAGNGGLAFGATLMEKGHEVNLYDKFDDILNPIIENNNCIDLVNKEKEISLKFSLVTNNLEEAVKEVEIVFVVTPAFAHRSVATDLLPHVTDEQIVILHPGRTGGALEVKNIFERNGKNKTIVAEAETLLFACRKLNETTIKIYGTKRCVGIAALPTSKTVCVTEKINNILPYFKGRSSVIETSLNNIGAIFHPTPFLLNIGRVEVGERFKFYHEGITPTVAKVLEELDKERVNIANNFGFKVPTALEWLNESYRLDGMTLYDAIQMNDSYSEIYAPMELHSRYVFEDVPMSLVSLSELAKLVQVDTPMINSIIELASKVFDIDFRGSGRTLDRLGVDKHFQIKDVIIV